MEARIMGQIGQPAAWIKANTPQSPQSGYSMFVG
jgi:hypothetical protein